MARQWRIEYAGAIYHVMSRGNALQDIFRTKDDRYVFLDLLGGLVERFNIEVHAYVLMGNHYHLLLKTNDANLSSAMQWFGTSYTRKFNLSNGVSGHLFQGRFKSIIVENDTYLLRLSCYIHRNPIRAGLAERLADYPWSSYCFYAYKKKVPDWLNIESVLKQLSGDDLQKAYRNMVQHYSDEQSSIWEDVKHGFIYGSQVFVSDLKSRFLDKQCHVELPQHNRLLRSADPQRLLKEASKVLDFDLEAARNAVRIAPEEKEKRDLLVYLLWKAGHMTNQQIGSLLGLTYSTVSKVVSVYGGRLKTERDLRSEYNMICSQFKV